MAHSLHCMITFAQVVYASRPRDHEGSDELNYHGRNNRVFGTELGRVHTFQICWDCIINKRMCKKKFCKWSVGITSIQPADAAAPLLNHQTPTLQRS